MHQVYLLAFATFVCVIGFLVWNRISTGRHRFGRDNPEGLGGENDPMAGATDAIRDPDELRASLDNAAARDAGRTPAQTSSRTSTVVPPPADRPLQPTHTETMGSGPSE